MSEQLIIEGDIVRQIRTEIISEAPLQSLAPFLTTKLPTTIPVLPQNPTRFLYFDPNAKTGIIIVETKPRRHVIQMLHERGDDDHIDYPEDFKRKDDDNISRFNVLLPWQYFAYTFKVELAGDSFTSFQVDRSSLFWAPEPYRTEDQLLWVAKCPNVDEDGRICWGGTASHETSLSARIDDLTNNFFVTIFNSHLGHTSPFDHSLTEWEKHSDGLLAHRDWPIWEPNLGTPVTSIAERMLQAKPTNMADLDPSFVNIPPLPENFTVARAQHWIAGLDDGTRRRLLAAVARATEETNT
jgi:hypothetical protein